jgi:hypothetical protein
MLGRAELQRAEPTKHHDYLTTLRGASQCSLHQRLAVLSASGSCLAYGHNVEGRDCG